MLYYYLTIVFFQKNIIFNTLSWPLYDVNNKGIGTGMDFNQDISYNILIHLLNGIASEDNSSTRINIHHNISTLNAQGVMLYYPPGMDSNPHIQDNNIWYNKAPPWVTTTDGLGNIVKGNEVDGAYAIHTYDSQNFSNNPNFRNISLYDLVHDTDNDGLFSDVESNSGTYTSPTDTGTDPWNPDSDDDGLLDGVETGTGIYNWPNDTGSDPNNWDTDEDGVDDGTEVRLGFNPVDPEDTPVLYEADVASRPDGDGQLLVNDWVQVGRFVAGLDSPAVGSEYQRVDCAPLDTSGDGQVLVNDWVQAGRYVAGLDAAQPQAGPIAPNAGR